MKAHIFLIANLKFRLQTPCSFGDMSENVKLIGIPINNFLCIYIIASSPGLHTLFCLWRVNKKLPQGETSQNTFQRSRSISWKCKIHMVKWAHPPLKFYLVQIIRLCSNFASMWHKHLLRNYKWHFRLPMSAFATAIWNTLSKHQLSHLILHSEVLSCFQCYWLL